MTEKRFTFDEDANEDCMYEMGVFSDNGKLMETTDVLNCLNNLHDENEQLKKDIGNLEHTRDFCAECCERLEKMNEQLQSEIRKWQREYVQLWMHTYK